MAKIFRFFKAIVCWCFGGCKIALTAEDRLEICRLCEHNEEGVCSICGCILKAKTKMDTERCPIDKW